MLALRVIKEKAQEMIDFLSIGNHIAREYMIRKGRKYIYIPVKDSICSINLPEYAKLVRTLLNKKEKTPTRLNEVINIKGFRAFDVIGDIALIEVPKGMESMEMEIGNAILKLHKNIHTVLAKEPVRGEFRTRNVHYVCGENKTETLHKEHGCIFKLDVSKVYFSQRLSHERKRIADMVKSGEKILVLFGGVGPFAIVIAKKHRDVKIYSVELNPDAHKYALENVQLNRVEDRVVPVYGDVKEVLKDPFYNRWADRIIMPLPWNAIEFIPYVIHASHPGTVLHIYTFCRPQEFDDVKHKVIELIGGSAKVIYWRRVRTYSPEIEQYVLDVMINV